MLLKIRFAMERGYPRCKLTEYIELDEGNFETMDKEARGEKKNRGRGSQKKSKVLILIESKPIKLVNKADSDKHKPYWVVGHVKLMVMEDLKGETINFKLTQSVDDKAVAITDCRIGYNKMHEN